MSTPETIEVPDALAASLTRNGGEEERAWIAALPALVARLLGRWDLERDGGVASGEASLVVPVRRADGTRAALKLQMPREETTAALTGLRAWNGNGVVRLLDHDPVSSAMLLERLDASRTLASVEDDDAAMRTLAGLLARLHSVPAPDGLRGLGGIAREMLEAVPGAVGSLTDPADRQRLRSWASAVTELVGEPGDRMLHWDLHYDNVLAAEREPWLAIDPEPLAGDPGFDLWPALDTGWEKLEAAGDPQRVVRRRFDLLTEALGLDRERAANWTLGRLLQNTLWDIEDGRTTIDPSQTAVADALSRR
ncbi:APH(6)-I family aminoglycoside O-phosphotransferase [Streptomyces sp. WAC05374]|uniref:APH(6)-I family aminoglycoside O-phosphotransferase n=1 Tax=Streptomyces sp. WAC05374 TaxID=2487420 RepID=UPI000F87C2FF|nr:APH(6)-I family aminoglycoside O-phosphotransferase [Streptomyces sp. WAC05374]RST10952.1 APH(6)-I family aminoglycoside O-phosphotransferase [Streptomyces sp. WAC05374]TDF42599.1 APH(6)-I family aminoglycoside O-phosphotransferase [Streptomyces sp. WAC05374]TDF51159.1 APH(6)-I family aminoglycoside O-phosphotransferase [Streptomyces sp. WAC05374]TDF52472.1 APH(6)-I family aminoglycoside O-phosphotransferase [Streptomyces sp. WAC05374]